MVDITDIKEKLGRSGVVVRLVNKEELRDLFNEKAPEVMRYARLKDSIERTTKEVNNMIQLKSQELLGKNSGTSIEYVGKESEIKDILLIENDKPGVLFIETSSWNINKLGLKYFPSHRDNIVTEVDKNVTVDNCLNVLEKSKIDYETVYKEAVESSKEVMELYYKEGETHFSKGIPMIIKDGEAQSNATDEYITLHAVQKAVQSLDSLLWNEKHSTEDIKKAVTTIANNI